MAKTILQTLLRKELNKVGERYVRNLKKSLERRGINNTGVLRDSIKFDTIIKSAADFEIRLTWKNYGDTLNQGAVDMGRISDAGFARVQRWVENKLGKPRYITGSGGRRVKNSKKIAFAIIKSWRKRKFPSRESNARGWATSALRSREIATTKVAVATALQTAFKRFTESKTNEREKQLRRNRR